MKLRPGDEVVLADGRKLHFFSKRLGDDATVPISGAVLYHPHKHTGAQCAGTLWFSNTGGDIPAGVPTFTLLQCPLNIKGDTSPSIAHKECGDHGYVIDGKWVDA